jgi:hypothetical protein
MKKYRESPERRKAHRNSVLKSKYKIDPELVDAAKVCDLCEGDFTNNTPYVDHNHQSGKVRGFLCMPCNVMIGYREKRALAWSRVEDYLRERD